MPSPDTVVLDLGNVVLRWDPVPALAGGVGDDEARRFLAGFDFAAWNHEQDAGRSWAEAQAWVAARHPEWVAHTRAYREHFAASITGTVDGTPEVVRALVGAGVPVHALTNWSAETFPLARERYDVLDLFDQIVVSGEVGVAKPDPAVYAHAEVRIGASGPEVFFADDSPANVEGAREAGWDAVLFTDAATLTRDLTARGLLAQ